MRPRFERVFRDGRLVVPRGGDVRALAHRSVARFGGLRSVALAYTRRGESAPTRSASPKMRKNASGFPTSMIRSYMRLYSASFVAV